MQIEFNVKSFDNNINALLSKELVDEYVQSIQTVVDQISVGMEVSRLTSIVIPDVFEDELFAFQKANGLAIEYTNNKIGIACAKTLHYTNDGRICYTIFLSKAFAYFIMSDFMIESKEDWDYLKKKRQRVINLIHHELAHVHYYSYKQNCFKYESSFNDMDKLDQFFAQVSAIIWEEYYACRFSIPSYEISWIKDDYSNLFNYIDSVKLQTENEIALFQTHKDDTKIFAAVQEGLQILLNSSAYLLGHLHIVENYDTRADLIQEIDDVLKDTFFHKIILDLSNQLDEIYDTNDNSKSYDIFSELTHTIKSCWNNLGISPRIFGNMLIVSVGIN